ncbi:MAG TPA: alpha/beta hydrolase [Casimicrobiaceae bacterium]
MRTVPEVFGYAQALLCALVACALIAATSARAQPAADVDTALAAARAHGAEAVQYERARNYRSAALEYQRTVGELDALATGDASAPDAAALPAIVYAALGAARLDLARAWLLSGWAQGTSAGEQAKYAANLAAADAALRRAMRGKPGDPIVVAKVHRARAWLAALAGDANAARAEAARADESDRDDAHAAALDRAVVALATPSGDTAAYTMRSGARVLPPPSDEYTAALKAVIDGGSFLAAMSPQPALDVATRGISTTSAECPPAFTGTCYPVWFGTNRKPIDPHDLSKGFGGDYDDAMHFGKRIVFIPRTHRPGELESPLWRRLFSGNDRIEVGPSSSLTERAFAQEIRDVLGRLDPADRNVLVFIHGFNTSFDDAARRAAQLGYDLQVPGVTAFYSWPSRGSARGYIADVENVEASEEQMAQFLVKVAALADRGHVHIIAHSMGNRGLLRAMHRATAQAALRSGVRFGEIFLAAPDVDAKLFRQLASIYPQISERTTLYVADKDKALAALEWFSDDPRAGSVPPLVMVPGIDTIRVRGTGLFRLGHSYVAEDVDVIRDISTLLYDREAPERRRARNGWPVPDRTPEGRGAWVIGN